MTEERELTRRGVLVLAGTSMLGVWSNPTPAKCEGTTGPSANLDALVGTWNAIERHKSHGSLFQPNHEARKRDAVIYFELDGDKLAGRSFTPNYKEIVGQGNWNGQTRLERVHFSDNKLVFEVTIVEWDQKLAPLSEELKRKNHKGIIRVEAEFKGDKLVGKWGVFTIEGAEIFRGEWEAVRADQPEK